MTAPGWHELATDAGLALLERISALHEGDNGPGTGTALEKIGTALRAEGTDPGLTAAALTQVELRIKARAKFGDIADRMLLTAAGLEQASRAVAARLHAERFVSAGCTTVADLGSGLGAESLAFLAQGLRVTAVERDPLTATYAAHNLALRSPSGPAAFTVRTEDATALPVTPLSPTEVTAPPEAFTDGVFLDPARRTAGHHDTRRVAVDDYSPPLSFAFSAARAARAGGVKLGPGFPRAHIPDDAEAQWVSVDGSVVEMALWFGTAAQPGVSRTATVVHTSRQVASTFDSTNTLDSVNHLSAAADSIDVGTRPLGTYLYEPDGAVIRARLIGALARDLDAGMLHDRIAYLTGDRLVPTPFATAFRILEQLPASEKQLRRALHDRAIGTLEVKKRGIDVDPAALRKRLKLRGEHSATLVLTRSADRHVALLVERC